MKLNKNYIIQVSYSNTDYICVKDMNVIKKPFYLINTVTEKIEGKSDNPKDFDKKVFHNTN